MKTPRIITGTDRKLTATWKVGDVMKPISDTAVVRFVLVSADHAKPYTNILTASKDAGGANWAKGVIVLIFPAAETVDIDYQGFAEVEIQVDDGGEKLGTFTNPVKIAKGNIG